MTTYVQPLRQSGPDGGTRDAEVRSWLAERLRAVICLAGQVRPNQLRAGIGRSMLDMPVDDNVKVTDLWQRELHRLLQDLGRQHLLVRTIVNRGAPRPEVVAEPDGLLMRIEEDPFEYRGTGGVLRDAAMEYEEDDLLLVFSGAQVPGISLADLVMGLGACRADIAFPASAKETAGGVILIRCGLLRAVPEVGFQDFKEQVLPALAERGTVSILQMAEPAVQPIRNRDEYISVLRRQHDSSCNGGPSDDPFAEHWKAGFAIIEPGADVSPSARIHDSVVLRGGRVEAGAAVVGSVVCPGGVVKRGKLVSDQVMAGRGESTNGKGQQ